MALAHVLERGQALVGPLEQLPVSRHNLSLGYGARTIQGITARLLYGYDAITAPGDRGRAHP